MSSNLSERLQGKCPECGWAGLFVGAGGYVTCSQYDCRNPCAPSEALGVKFPDYASEHAAEALTLRDEALRLNNALAAENDRLRDINNAFVAQNDALQGEVERLIRERGTALATIARMRTGRP